MTYRITFQRQLNVFASALFWLLLFSCLCSFMFGWSDAVLYTSLFIFIFDTLPTLILHIQYLHKNWHAELTIDRSSNHLTYLQDHYSLCQSLENLQEVEKIRSYNYYSGLYSFQHYFYYNLTFKDGNSLIITCLLAEDLEAMLIPKLSQGIMVKKKAIAFI